MIEPKSKSISEIFLTGKAKLSVPKYQRDFNWGVDELQELIDDLKSGIEKDRELFLGNFIFDISNKKDHQIVDGQQRITTISIILIAARETAKKINETKLVNSIQNAITFKDELGDDSDIRVTVSPGIKDVYEYMASSERKGDFPDKIGSKHVKRPISKIKPIYKSIFNEIQNYDKITLRNFIKRLYDSYVTLIEVESEEDVFDIFERTNARGLDLNVSDLVKNAIFAHDMKKHEENWNEIRTNGDGTLPKMLKYFRVSRKGYIRKDDLYRAIKTYAKEVEMDNLVYELLSFSKYYRSIQSDSQEEIKKWLDEFGLNEITNNQSYLDDTVRVFQALKFFNVTQAYPIIYSILQCYKNSNITNKGDTLVEFLKVFEKYHFMNNMICTRIGNDVEKLYANWAPIFFGSAEYTKDKNAFVSELREQKVKKDEFIASFNSITYPDDRPLIHYVFDRINNFGLKGSQIIDLFTPDKKGIKRNDNIEHILAQSSKEKGDLSEELIEKVDNIGNLLVISRHTNGSLGDKPVKEKFEIFKEPQHSGKLVYLKKFVEDYEQFCDDRGIEAIEKRADDLAGYAFTTVWNF